MGDVKQEEYGAHFHFATLPQPSNHCQSKYKFVVDQAAEDPSFRGAYLLNNFVICLDSVCDNFIQVKKMLWL